MPAKLLTSYQSEVVCSPWYDPTGRHALTHTFVKARRIGGSTAAAFCGALRALGRELRPDGTFIQHAPCHVWIVSKDFQSSKGLIREIASVCAELAPLDPDFIVDAKATSVKFRTGTTATALPCSDKAIRGWTGFFICDEVAFWRQPEEVWGAAKVAAGATLSEARGFGLLCVTTPWESGSLAHSLFTDPSLPFIRHSVDIYQAKAAGFPVDIELARRELGIPELFATEFECAWSRGGATFFPIDRLRESQEDELPEGWERAPAFFGIDVGGGRGRDFTAAVQWRLIGQDLWIVGVRASNVLKIDEQATMIGDWIASTNDAVHVEIRVDRGMMGQSLIDLLEARLRRRKRTAFGGMGMAPSDQEQYAGNLKRALERGKLRIYTGTEAGGEEDATRTLMLELSRLKTKPGVGGLLSFITPRDPTRGHCDRAWASMIGCPESNVQTMGDAAQVHTSEFGSAQQQSDNGGSAPGVHVNHFDNSGLGF